MTLAVGTAARRALAEESGAGAVPLPQFSGRSSDPATFDESVGKMEVYPAFEAEPHSKGGKNKVEVPHLQDFDPVPEIQREPVIRRLKMIERLIRDHGRAYDYRELTTTELNAILQALEQKKSLRTSGKKSQ